MVLTKSLEDNMAFLNKISIKQNGVFLFLLVYIAAFIFWWSFLLINKNEQYYHLLINGSNLKIENSSKISLLFKERDNQSKMIIGEGITFLGISLAILFSMRKSFQKEVKVANQQQNFLLSITHELKSPIASALLNTQTQLKRKLDLANQQILNQNTEKDLKRLGILVDKILLASKMEDKTTAFFLEKLNLSNLVNEIFEVWRNQWSDKFKFEINIEPNLLIIGDASLINSMLSNLIENAIKYSIEGGKISVELIKENFNIILSVADEGKGIPKWEQKNIYDKFYRIGNEETRTTTGTGLGLFIVKQAAIMHNATINIESEIEKGTKFKIVFK